MIGDRLKRLRELKDVKQYEVAEYLHIKRQTYSGYESNKSVPDAIILKKLSQYFGVSADEILDIDLDEYEVKNSLKVLDDEIKLIFDKLSLSEKTELKEIVRLLVEWKNNK